jgi:hypothetical protein
MFCHRVERDTSDGLSAWSEGATTPSLAVVVNAVVEALILAVSRLAQLQLFC